MIEIMHHLIRTTAGQNHNIPGFLEANYNLKKRLTSKRKRRLAIIDTKFPWKLSGFRYWENMEFYRRLPDTLFFASEIYFDPFPGRVHPFSEFTKIAKEQGITDIYCVFLNVALSLLGEYRLKDGSIIPGANPNMNIRNYIFDEGIQLHTTIYPGGGLDPQTPDDFLIPIRKFCTTVFTNANEVMRVIPGSYYVAGICNTNLYTYEPKKATRPVHLVFCANKAVRKGFPYVAAAFNQLHEGFHLHIIGDWKDDLYLLKNKNYTYHGLLEPESIRKVYSQAQVFINCSIPDQFALDGFPTAAAVDAMSAGCILVTTNPRNDRHVLQKDEHYFEFDHRDLQGLVRILNYIYDHMDEALVVAHSGANMIRRHFEVETNVDRKIKAMLSL